MPADKVLIERRGAVTVLTLNRPEIHNCVDAETADAISAGIEAFAADALARVLVVTGAGEEAFCAGADLRDIEGLMLRRRTAQTGPLEFLGPGPRQAEDRGDRGPLHRGRDRAGLLVRRAHRRPGSVVRGLQPPGRGALG